MGLKLTLTREDKVLIGREVVIDVRTLSNKQVQLEFTAPDDVDVVAVFKDSSKQFRNARQKGKVKDEE